MRAFTTTLIALAIASVSTYGRAADWQPTKERDGVQLYAKNDPNEGLKSFKGVIRIKASMKQALAAVLVRESFPEWVFNMLEDKTLPTDNADQSYCYMWIKGVWPTSDRDTVARVTVEQNPKTFAVAVVAKSTEQNRVPLQKERVCLCPPLKPRFNSKVSPILQAASRISSRTWWPVTYPQKR